MATSVDSPSQTLGGFWLAGLLTLGAPFILRLACGDPFIIVCAAASLSLGTATVIHTGLGGLASNNLEIEGQGDKILEFLPKIGIKGRFTAATAVFCFTFMLFIGASILLRKTESTEAKVKDIVPNAEAVTLKMLHQWGNAPPKYFTVKLGETPIGVLTEEQLRERLTLLAADGFDKKAINTITSGIAKDCNRGEGVCKIPDRLKLTVSFSKRLSVNKANICQHSDLVSNIQNGDSLNVTPFPDSSYVVPIKPTSVSVYNDIDACGADGKTKTADVWIQLSEEHAEHFSPRTTQFTTGWVTIQK